MLLVYGLKIEVQFQVTMSDKTYAKKPWFGGKIRTVLINPSHPQMIHGLEGDRLLDLGGSFPDRVYPL